MPGIQRLSQEVIAQIAAGEVVERPASVVKELVENSIDAGAASVTVELREGGIRYLRVTDNGRGIPAEQIRLAFERHATSKLVKSEQLYGIQTLGFRGEALASIAAVAKVTCTTRTQDADFGTRALIEAGIFQEIRQAASPVGTTFVVENLFQNVPVRLKFLRKPAAEAATVSEYMLRLILSRPDIAFRFVSQGKTVYHSVGDGKLESVLFSLYGADAFRLMRKVHGCMNGVTVDGCIGVGELSRGNRQQQSFFVNGRCFRSAALSKALEDGCEGRVMVGRFPMAALFLEMPYQLVDVNVHPNKLEVRFQNENAVAEAVTLAVRDVLHSEKLGERLTEQKDAVTPSDAERGFTVVTLAGDETAVPLDKAQIVEPPEDLTGALPERGSKELSVPASSQGESSAAVPVSQPDSSRPVIEETPEKRVPVLRETVRMRYDPQPRVLTPEMSAFYGLASSLDAADAAEVRKPEMESPPAQLTILPEEASALRLIGVAFDTYWIFESGDRLLLVDQHAAHERILYDKLMKLYEGEHISQRLLAPQMVRLTARDLSLISEYGAVLEDAGFEVEPFDDVCVSVRAIPTLFGRNDSPRELLLEALDECQEGRGQMTRERFRRQVAQMACKRAVKGGDKLSPMEMEAFLKQMLESDSMPTCPHGRPIVSEVTRYALEKRFKRVQ